MRFLLLLPVALFSTMANANDCEIDVSSADTFSYSVRSITVPASCDEFTVNFEHKGKMPKTAMGHSWVLVNNNDLQSVIDDGQQAGIENDFLAPGDARIIAATPLLGGGEKATTKFSTSKLSADEQYTFFCSYRGHYAMMKGSLKLGE